MSSKFINAKKLSNLAAIGDCRAMAEKEVSQVPRTPSRLKRILIRVHHLNNPKADNIKRLSFRF